MPLPRGAEEEREIDPIVARRIEGSDAGEAAIRRDASRGELGSKAPREIRDQEGFADASRMRGKACTC